MSLYLIETLRELWSERLGNRVEIYCQCCGIELTDKGGDVSISGGVYCNDKIKCVVACSSLSLMTAGEITVGPSVAYSFVSPRGLQKLVRKDKLTKFGPLEKEALQI